MLYPHKLKVKCRSNKGLHKPGVIGTYLSTADGFGNFFPLGGGVVLRLPTTAVARIAPVVPAAKVRKVVKLRKVVRLRKIRRAVTRETKVDQPRKLRRG